MRPWIALALLLSASGGLATARGSTPAEVPAAVPKLTRLGDGPILRPEMMPKDDGEWSGNLNCPSLIRVPDWMAKPLGKYYLYFSAHHGSYIRMAYADRLTGPWKVYEPGTLRLEQVEAVNHAGRSPQRHVASPDVHPDDAHRQIRMYFHYNLPKLGHSSSVAVSSDGLKFEPWPGRIAGPYLRVIRRGGAYLAVDDAGVLLKSPDGLEPFEAVSEAVKTVAGGPAAREGRLGGKQASHFRHGCLWPAGDTLSVFFTRIGDAPEQILLTRVKLSGDPSDWRASPPAALLAPDRDYEGAKFPLVPSTFTGQTNVRQLRDPYVFREEGHTYLLYAVAGETGIALAEIENP